MQPTTDGNIGAKKILKLFIQGLIILAPIALTAFILYTLFNFVDGILRPVVNIRGLGFIILIAFVILIGWISSNFLVGSLLNVVDRSLEKTPGIKVIYTSIKDFFSAFSGNKQKFNKPVLANVFGEDVWVIGFLTDEDMSRFAMDGDKVAVYVPQSYNFAGQLFILPRHKVKSIEHISAGDAMKYSFTGGVVDVVDDLEVRPLAQNLSSF